MPQRAALPVTAGLVTLGLAGGFAVAQGFDSRVLGGVFLGGCGLAAGVLWLRRTNTLRAVSLGSIYAGAFVFSHQLAGHIGAWPSVAALTSIAAGAAYVGADRVAPRQRRQHVVEQGSS